MGRGSRGFPEAERGRSALSLHGEGHCDRDAESRERTGKGLVRGRGAAGGEVEGLGFFEYVDVAREGDARGILAGSLQVRAVRVLQRARLRRAVSFRAERRPRPLTFQESLGLSVFRGIARRSPGGADVPRHRLERPVSLPSLRLRRVRHPLPEERGDARLRRGRRVPRGATRRGRRVLPPRRRGDGRPLPVPRDDAPAALSEVKSQAAKRPSASKSSRPTRQLPQRLPVPSVPSARWQLVQRAGAMPSSRKRTAPATTPGSRRMRR